MADEYLSTDPNAGVEDSGYLSTDPNAGLEPKPEGGIVSNAIAGAGDVIKGFAQQFIPDLSFKNLAAIAYAPVNAQITGYNALKSIVDTGQQVAEAEKTPPFSRERFAAGFNVAGQLGLLAAGGRAPKLAEIAGIEKPITPEAMPQTPEPLVSEVAAVEPIKTAPVEEVIQNAEQIQSPTRPDVNVQLPSGASAREVGGGEVPANVGGEGVPTRGQGETLQQTQEVAPVPQPEQPTTGFEDLRTWGREETHGVSAERVAQLASPEMNNGMTLSNGAAVIRNFDKLTPEEQSGVISSIEREVADAKERTKSEYKKGRESAKALKGTDFEGRGMEDHKSALRTQRNKESLLERLKSQQVQPSPVPSASESTTASSKPKESVPTEATTAQPLPQEVIPDWLRQERKVWSDIAEKSGVADKIEELHAQRFTAREIADQLGIDTAMVRAVRAARGLPERTDAMTGPMGTGGTGGANAPENPAFTEWVNKRTPSVVPPPVETPTAEAPKTGVSSERFTEQYGEDAPVPNTGKSAGQLKAIGQSRLDNFQKTGDVKNDPYAVLTNLREGKVPVSQLADDVSLLRAEHQRLKNDAINAEGTPDWEAKSQASLDMAQAIKEVAHGPASDMMRSFQEYDVPRYDNVTDFDQALRERLGRESTSQERVKFKEMADDVVNTRNGAQEAINGVQKKLNKMPKMEFEEAAKNIHDQITELTKNCVI